MAYEFRELDDKESKLLVDYGQRIVALNAKKSVFAAERKVSESKRSERIASIDAEIEKNTSTIIAIRNVSVSDKVFSYDNLADVDVKTIVDLTQRNYSLTLEKVKIQAEKEAEDKFYNTQYANIDTAILNLTNEIAAIREAVEIG